MLDNVRAIAVDVQPGQRIVQHRSMEQRALRALGRLNIEELRLDRQDLAEAFDVTTGDWQQAELDALFEGIGGESLALHQPERLQ